MTEHFFITGTDTDVGKTLISSAYLLKAKQQGLTTLGLKPVAAGCELSYNTQGATGEWQNTDALLHQQYSHPPQPYKTHNPITLRAAIAPHIAAQQEQRPLSVKRLLAACEPALMQKPNILIIEGAGGWQVPLNSKETLADFAIELAVPVILVVGMKLGCINHALLSVAAIRQTGLKLAGWVANQLPPSMSAMDENVHYLQQEFNKQNIPCLGVVPPVANLNCADEGQLQRLADLLQWPTIQSEVMFKKEL